MTQEIKSAWPAAVIVGVVLLIALVWGLFAINSNVKNLETPNVDLTSVVNAINANSAKIDSLTISLANPSTEANVPGENVATTGYTLTKKEYERDITEAKALELATEFVNSKDFKKEAFNALNLKYNETTEVGCLLDDSCPVKSYKDITSIKLGDTEVSKVNSDTYDVLFGNIKVYYFVDGDEEETEKALLVDFEITVDNLDFDDEFIDAEADEDLSLVISKVY